LADALGNVGLQSYASDTQRRNAFNQTDLVWRVEGAYVSHQVLAGIEVGSQYSRNRRTPNNDAAGIVSLRNPTSFGAVSMLMPLQSDNEVDVRLAALYVQDQLSFGTHIKLLAGARLDHFSLSFDDRRPANADARRTDRMFSPRFGLVYQPTAAASLYASYSVSHLPQSGDQFGSLTATTAALEPERFRNLELGLKQELRPGFVFEAAAYRLERSNTTATDPVSGQLVLTGRQRTRGLELGLAGAVNPRWQVSAGYARQDARIVSDTASAPRGRRTPLVPAHSIALWNRYQLTPRWATAIGVTRQSDSYASISNAVTLPAYSRVDAALYWQAGGRQQLQLNIENLLDARYYPTAHNDNNITPGAPLGVRLAWQLRW
jgi:catecholate siderophore receptor